jgi:hypothetical protein
VLQFASPAFGENEGIQADHVPIEVNERTEGESVRYHVEIICRDNGKASRSLSTSNPSSEERRFARGF